MDAVVTPAEEEGEGFPHEDEYENRKDVEDRGDNETQARKKDNEKENVGPIVKAIGRGRPRR